MSKTQKQIIGILAGLFLITGIFKSGIFTNAGNFEEHNSGQAIREARMEFQKSYRLASDLKHEKKYQQAAVYYKKALKLNETHEGALYNLGIVNLLLRNFRDAENQWKTLSKLNPRSARAWQQLGILYFCKDDDNLLFDPELAKANLIKAGDLNREETGPSLLLSKIGIFESELIEAEEHTDIVLAQNFFSYQAIFLKGFIEWKKGKEESAGDRFREAADLYSSRYNATIVGEGATKKGVTPMFSDNIYCDFLGNQIEKLMGTEETLSHSIYREFERKIHQ